MATGYDANIAAGAGQFSSGRSLTAEDFYMLPSDGRRLELVAGEINENSPCGFDHGVVLIQLGALLMNFAKKRCLGSVSGGDIGFIVARNPDTVLAPDIAFVRSERIPAEGCPQFMEGAPDLAVEIVSPNDRRAEVEAKARHWLGCGTRLVWVVNGATKSVTIYRAGGERSTISIDDALDGTLDGGDVLPGFSCPVRRIFEV